MLSLKLARMAVVRQSRATGPAVWHCGRPGWGRSQSRSGNWAGAYSSGRTGEYHVTYSGTLRAGYLPHAESRPRGRG